MLSDRNFGQTVSEILSPLSNITELEKQALISFETYFNNGDILYEK